MGDALLFDRAVAAPAQKHESHRGGPGQQRRHPSAAGGEQRRIGEQFRGRIGRQTAGIDVAEEGRPQPGAAHPFHLGQPFGKHEVAARRARQQIRRRRLAAWIEHRRHPAEPLGGQRQQHGFGARIAEEGERRARTKTPLAQGTGQRADFDPQRVPTALLPYAKTLVAQRNGARPGGGLFQQPARQAGRVAVALSERIHRRRSVRRWRRPVRAAARRRPGLRVRAPAAAPFRRNRPLLPGNAGSRTAPDRPPPPSARRCVRRSAGACR